MLFRSNPIQQHLKLCKDYGKVDYVLKHAKVAKDFGLQKYEFTQFVGDVGVGSKEEVFELFEKVLPEAAVVYPYESWKERFVPCMVPLLSPYGEGRYTGYSRVLGDTVLLLCCSLASLLCSLRGFMDSGSSCQLGCSLGVLWVFYRGG